jgi:hypothetical protein
MLNDSGASTSLDNPLPVDEDSKDFEILLHVIVGRGEEVSKSVMTWDQAERLYRMAEKYQVDSQRPWFSRMCARCACKKPWDALSLACNTSPMDTDIIREAVSEGIPEFGIEEDYHPRYFKEERYDEGEKCWSMIQIANITPEFGLKLGLLGLVSYGQTFASIKTVAGSVTTFDEYHQSREEHSWADFAQDFVRNAREVEEARGVVSNQHVVRWNPHQESC